MRNKVIIGYLIVLILIPISLGSTNPHEVEKTTTTIAIEWENTFGGISNELPCSLIQTTDGGFVLAGWTTSYGAGGRDFWLVKTDTNGQAEWNKTYGGIADEDANSLIQTADGGFVFVGGTGSYGAGSGDFWIMKMDANGQAEWNQTYGGIDDDFAASAVQTTDGGYAFAGGTESYGAGETDFWLVKTDANGQAEWNHTFEETTSEGPISLIQTTDGGYAFVGTTGSFGAGNGDMWLVKVQVSEGPTTTTPSWTPIIVLMSITALITTRKRKKIH